MKLMVVEPAGMMTEPGTATLGLLVDNPMVIPPLGAGKLRTSVHGTVAGPTTEDGVHVRPLNCEVVEMAMVAVRVCPPAAAVTIALEEACVADAVAANEALVAPPATSTDGGTDNFGLSLDKATSSPPPDAALPRVTVQVTDPPEAMLAGQVSEDNCVPVETSSAKLRDTALSVAVRSTATSAVTAAIVAVNAALVAPAAMLTEVGTVTLVLLLDSPAVSPPAGAGRLSVTAQEAVAGLATVAGLHAIPLN